MPTLSNLFVSLRRIAVSVLIMAILSNSVFAATFTIDTDGEASDNTPGDGSCDDGAGNCTIKAAIDEVNALAGVHTVNVSGVRSAAVTAPLPSIVSADVIFDLNSSGTAFDLDGTAIPFSADGLAIDADGVTINGAYIHGFLSSGVAINSGHKDTTISDNVLGANFSGVKIETTNSDILISNNKIGTNAAGDAANANEFGISMTTNADNNFNSGDGGGVGVADGLMIDGNVISGNNVDGIKFDGSAGTDKYDGNITIQNNCIGTSGSGAGTCTGTDLGNAQKGVYMAPGTNLSANIDIVDNVIAGNNTGGIVVPNDNNDVAGDSILIDGNKFGTHDGTTAIASVGDAILVNGESVTISNNIIGNYAGDGIELSGDEADDATIVITGNNIGVAGATTGIGNGGTGDFGNDQSGILVNDDNIASVTIGGNNASDGNVIGNNLRGIDVSNTKATATTNIYNNYIGVEADGATSAAQTQGALHISDGGTTNVGGDGKGNVLSNASSGSNGILVEGGGAVTIQGNKIGTTISGLVAASNAVAGISVSGAGVTSLIIGGATAALGNVISANGTDGIEILQVANSSTVVSIMGNYIGIGGDGTTTAGMTNGASGISLEAGAVTVGGDNSLGALGTGALGEGNVISNNTVTGIEVSGSGMSALNVFGNIIGLKKGGGGVYDTAAGNVSHGVSFPSPTNIATVVIGASDFSKRNIISGNGARGIDFTSAVGALTSIVIKNNYVGTDYLGVADVGNTGAGIIINVLVSTTVAIGGILAGEENVISGNGDIGIQAKGGLFTILGNIVGLNAAGDAALGNSGYGININGANASATLGNGTDDGRNVVSGNAGAGVSVSTALSALIQGNYIGLNLAGDAALGNGSDALGVGMNNGGVFLMNSTADAVIFGSDGDGVNDANEGNHVSGNYGQGVLVIAANGMKIAGNYIGLDATGLTAIPNQAGSEGYDLISSGETAYASPTKFNGSGIIVYDTFANAINNLKIGHDTIANLGNVIGSNVGSGIVISGDASGTGQDWSSGYIKNNKIGVLADGTTESVNGGYNLYVDDQLGASTISNLSIGGSQNVFNNGASGDVGIFMNEITDAKLAAGSKLTDLYANNTFTEGTTPPSNRYWEQWISGVLTDWSPKYICSDGLDNDGDGQTDFPTDDGCSSATDSDETDPVVTPPASGGGGAFYFIGNNTKQNIVIPDKNDVKVVTEVAPPKNPVPPTQNPVESVVEEGVNAAENVADYIVYNIEEVVDGGGEKVLVSGSERGALYEFIKSQQDSSASGERTIREFSEQAQNIIALFDADSSDYEGVKAVIVGVITEFLDGLSVEESLVFTAGDETFISADGFDLALTDEELASIKGANPGMDVITPSTVNSDGVGILYSLMNDLNPFALDSNGNGVPNITELFVHNFPDKGLFDLSEALKKHMIVTNLQSFNDLPILFTNNNYSNRVSISIFGEDGPYESLVAKIIEPDEEVELKDGEEEPAPEFEEIERGEGEIEGNKDIYTMDNYLEDGKYYILINRKSVDGEEIKEEDLPVYIAEFEVVSNKLLETSELDLSKESIIEDDQVKEVEVIRGTVNRPGATVFISFQSVVFNSVVIADANGNFALAVPEGLPDGQHEIVVYAYDEDLVQRRGIVSNLSRLIFIR